MHPNNFLNTIQTHPIVVIVTSAVAAGMVVFGVVSFLCSAEKTRISQLYEQEKNEIKSQFDKERNELNSRMATIERRLGGERLLDIAKLVSPHSPEKIDQSKGLDHFREMNFFALRDEAKWETKSVTEAEHVQQTLGVPLSNLFGREIGNELNSTRGLRWMGKNGIKFQYTEQENIYVEEHPFIFVQKFSPTDNFNYIRILSTSFTRQSLRAGESAIREIKELVKSLAPAGVEPAQVHGIPTGIYKQDDHPGSFLFIILRQIYNSVLWGKSASVKIRHIQKFETVVYAQVIIQESSLKFDNYEGNSLWIVREFILFPFLNHIMMISTYVPTVEPRFSGGYFTDVNAWLLSFYLVSL